MKFFGPKHTPESVAAQLIEGLENGTLTLDDPEENAPEHQPAPPTEPAQATGFVPLWATASFALAVVATGIVSAVLLLATQEPLPWAVPVACFVACAVCTAVAFWLGTTSVLRASITDRLASAPKLPSPDLEQRTAAHAPSGEACRSDANATSGTNS